MVRKRTPEAADNGADWLGYAFRDPDLLRQALTHGSSPKSHASYERLEFLGDRVLSLVVAEALFVSHHKEREGKLAARHSAIVRGEVCAEIAEKLGLAERLHVGAVERKLGVQKMRSVLGDVMEAVIGAIYMDGGFEISKAFVLRHWEKTLTNPATAIKDPKTFVQEWALARGKALPAYEVLARSGPEHRPEFAMRLLVPDHGTAEGRGSSKQAAEKAAAIAFISEKGLR
jgi:ribonuclease III